MAQGQVGRPEVTHLPTGDGQEEVESPSSAEAGFRRAGFQELPGWSQDRVSEALPAFLTSCRVVLGKADHRRLDPRGRGGVVAEWREACGAAARLSPGDDGGARRFLEEHFVPLAVHRDGDLEGLFTGYYEISLRGSRERSKVFSIPLYRRPPELVMVDLGKFRKDLLGRRVAGRVSGGALLPFGDRAAIEDGALAGRGLELCWVDDPVDAFILHVQGSGLVELAEGGSMRVGYDGQNGHAYVSVGRVLVDRGELSREDVTLQAIREWLGANAEDAQALLNLNTSYVFFRELLGGGPLGAQGVALTPGRSVAVDRTELPLGALLWIDSSVPGLEPGQPDRSLSRLVVAQDTGGAIRGPVRIDLFWGSGAEAESLAGRMKHLGRVWLLLPSAVAERLLASSAAESSQS
jgi:membrane-bound lytic murein transglycosylase A